MQQARFRTSFDDFYYLNSLYPPGPIATSGVSTASASFASNCRRYKMAASDQRKHLIFAWNQWQEIVRQAKCA